MSAEIAVRNPRSGELDYVIQALASDEVAHVAEQVRAAQPEWLAKGLEHRSQILRDWASAVAADSSALADALSVDTGRNLIAAVEVGSLTGMVEGWLAAAPAILDEGEPQSSATPGVIARHQYVPYQLAGIISPWNFPFLLSMIDAIPALVAGCGVIVKPSEVTPRFIKPVRESLDAFPELAAVFQWIEGDGKTGAALINEVDALAFTGSVATGRQVAEQCARNFIPAFLELGGKDPALIMPDADIQTAARIVLRASVQATGQACQSLERIYVHASLHDAFAEELLRQANAVELSYPDPGQGQIGPLIFARQADIVAAHIADACAKGAQLLCGGDIETLGGGLWVRPTVLTGVDHSMQLMTQETFGPVMPVMSYGTLDEAVGLANDSEYGLSASVIGTNIEAAIEVARRLNAGAVSINDGGLTTEVHDVGHDSFGLSGMGAGRMGSTGLTRFMRQKALLLREDSAKGIESVDENLVNQNIED